MAGGGDNNQGWRWHSRTASSSSSSLFFSFILRLAAVRGNDYGFVWIAVIIATVVGAKASNVVISRFDSEQERGRRPTSLGLFLFLFCRDGLD